MVKMFFRNAGSTNNNLLSCCFDRIVERQIIKFTLNHLCLTLKYKSMHVYGVEPSDVQALKNPKSFEGC